MRGRAVVFTGVLLAAGFSSGSGQEQAQATAQWQARDARCAVRQNDAVVVHGAGIRTTSFTLAELKTLPLSTVRAVGHDGHAVSYRGVALLELLQRAGGVTGGQIRGAALRSYLVAEAADGYGAVIAYAEADTSYRAEPIIVAYEADGAALDATTGPLQLVIPADRRHGRWVRQLECVRVARDTLPRH